MNKYIFEKKEEKKFNSKQFSIEAKFNIHREKVQMSILLETALNKLNLSRGHTSEKLGINITRNISNKICVRTHHRIHSQGWIIESEVY